MMADEQIKGCVFCDIANETTSTELVHKEEDYVVFRDIRPATPHHYLIIPRRHYKNVKSLTYEHKEIIEKLVQIGLEVLEKQGGNKDDVRLGFHWPPFHTVSHLHLHAIGQVDKMSFLSKIIFKPNSLWFVTSDYVLERLESMKPE